MNWEKLKEKFPNIYEDIRELEKEKKHNTSRELLLIYLEKNNIKCNFLHYGLSEAENKKTNEICKENQ